MKPHSSRNRGPFWGLAPLAWLVGAAVVLVGLGWLWNWVIR